MVNIFIDTNVLLNLYHFSGDDLEQIEKLVLMLRSGKATFYLTEQVRDEFNRNRDNKIADALKEFRREKLDLKFPQITKHYEEYKKLMDAIKSFEANKQALIEKLKKDIFSNSLRADETVKVLFDNAIYIKTSEEIFTKARLRFDMGKPPGKNKSYGDALNWESLIAEFPNNVDIYFVTEDSDYLSELDNNIFNPYLASEWYFKKQSNLILFKNLTDFFRKNFPDIKLAVEHEKYRLIEDLSKSKSFSKTHSILTQIAKFNEFSQDQVNDIVLASISNKQIYWIRADINVRETLWNIVRNHKKIIDPELLTKFTEMYPPPDFNEKIEN